MNKMEVLFLIVLLLLGWGLVTTTFRWLGLDHSYLISHQCDYPRDKYVSFEQFMHCVNFKKAGTNEWYSEEQENHIRALEGFG